MTAEDKESVLHPVTAGDMKIVIEHIANLTHIVAATMTDNPLAPGVVTQAIKMVSSENAQEDAALQTWAERFDAKLDELRRCAKTTESHEVARSWTSLAGIPARRGTR